MSEVQQFQQVQSENVNERTYRYIGQKQLKKQATRKSNFIYDATSTRLCFSNSMDIAARVMWIMSVLLLMASSFFIAVFIGKVLVAATNFSPLLNILADPMFRFMTLSVVLVGILILFAYLITIIVVKTIRSVTIFSIIYLTLGQVYFIGFLVGAFLLYLGDSSSFYNLITLALAGLAELLLLIGCFVQLINCHSVRVNLEWQVSQIVRTYD